MPQPSNQEQQPQPNQLSTSSITDYSTNLLNIAFWNIGGVSNLFNPDICLNNNLLSCEVICLCETWYHNENINLPKSFQPFSKNIYINPAVKDKQKGRASSGFLILIKDKIFDTIKLISQSQFYTFLELTIKGNVYIIGTIYLSPSLNDFYCLQVLFEMVEEVMNYYHEHNILLLGDYNAKIGNLNQMESDIFTNLNIFKSRISSNLQINKRGSLLVDKMEALGLFVLNGRTAGDYPALVGSLTIGTTFAISPIAGILTDRIGIRLTTLIGGGLAALGMFCSSFLDETVEALYVTYGLMYGLGAALTYTPSLAILNHYFHKYLGFVNGIVTAGSSVFTIIMPFFMESVIKKTGLQGNLWVLAALSACILLCAMLFKPLPALVKPKEKKMTFRGMVNVSIFNNRRYVIWATVIPLSLFGYFVPYVHMKKFVEETYIGWDGKLPVVCIGITSGIGRLIFGYIADFPKVDRIMLQQISFLVIGISTMCLPFCSSFAWLLTISLIMGLFDGCFIALLGPNAFDICGQEGAAQAIGFLLGLCSIPLTFGPPIAGMIYDHTKSYQLPMLLAGVPPILGFVAMFLIRCVKIPPTDDKLREPLNQPEIIRQPQIINMTETCNGNQAKLASSESLDCTDK